MSMNGEDGRSESIKYEGRGGGLNSKKTQENKKSNKSTRKNGNRDKKKCNQKQTTEMLPIIMGQTK